MSERLLPETERQAQELVRWAVAGNKTIAIQGENTKQGFGLLAETDCMVSMRNLAGIVEYHPEELVMQALPGTPVEEIKQELDKHDQRLEFEPLSLNKMYQTGGEGTIGGVFSGNLAGPRRFKAGSARDHILGIKAINGRGETYKSGGKVIKNVSGYDLSKLIAGSWGTLSIITEVTFKVLPAPATSATLAVQGLSTEQGLKLLAAVLSTPCETSGLAYLPAPALAAIEPGEEPAPQDTGSPPGKGDSGGSQGGGNGKLSFPDESMTLIRLEGTELSVNERIQTLRKLLPGDRKSSIFNQVDTTLLWSKIRDVAPLHDVHRTSAILKISTPPMAVPGLTRFLDQSGGCIWYLDAAGNWLWVGVCQAATADKLNSIRREVSASGGSATLYRAPDAVKKNTGIYSFPDNSIKNLNEKIKNSFDPGNIFNPDRLYSL